MVLEHKIPVSPSLSAHSCHLLHPLHSVPLPCALCRPGSLRCSSWCGLSWQLVIFKPRSLLASYLTWPPGCFWYRKPLLEIIILASVSPFYLVFFFFKKIFFLVLFFSVSVWFFAHCFTDVPPAMWISPGLCPWLSFETTCGVICPAIKCSAACSCLVSVLHIYLVLFSDFWLLLSWAPQPQYSSVSLSRMERHFFSNGLLLPSFSCTSCLRIMWSLPARHSRVHSFFSWRTLNLWYILSTCLGIWGLRIRAPHLFPVTNSPSSLLVS